MLETRNIVLRGWDVPWWRFVEWREVRRLRAGARRPREARVATVIPTYLRSELLQQAVASALAQTIQDQIVIVVDDGGGLPALPADDRLVTVSLSRNTHRLGLVRNVGIRLTRSRYVAFLDDDNVWSPTHLSEALVALESGADLVYTAVQRLWEDGTELDVLSRDFDREAFRDGTPFVDANAVVVRRARGVRFSCLRRETDTL
ncbi:glycosyltransferase family A protein, partial [Intrasporangium chromatireducens]